jgi:hypothetical protein
VLHVDALDAWLYATRMKAIYVIGLTLCTLACSCDKGASNASPSVSSGPGAAPVPAAAAEPDCEKVVEKIASLNPPDMRGEPEKKLWRAMCAQMKPSEKTCVMGAKSMDEMKNCMKK